MLLVIDRLLMDFLLCFFFFKQKTAYEMRISDWSSDVCSSDLAEQDHGRRLDGDRQQDLERMEAGTGGHVDFGVGMMHPVQPPQQCDPVEGDMQIGRASCRERVCQYV